MDIKVPDEAALAIATSAFGKEVQEQIVGEVVKQALTVKIQRGYGATSKTVLEEIIEAELHSRMRALARAWIAEHDLEIQQAVAAALQSAGVEEMVTEAVTARLQTLMVP